MKFRRVNDELAEEGSSLTILPLKVLQPARDPYDALLVQPLGTMQATEQCIGHRDQDAAIKLYQDLLSKACENAVDLVVTPEYCVPWRVIEDVSEAGLKPKQEALWVLGCESITLGDLESFKVRQEGMGVKVLFEELPQQNKEFLCPLLYVFWVKDEDDAKKLCILIQFKSVPSNNTVEFDHLYLGATVYVFGDGDNELNLLSLICADVFELTEEDIKNQHRDALILHVQLNEKPWHQNFNLYRKRLFSLGSNNNVELMCLNWATGITWNNDGVLENIKTWDNSSNSAFYIPKRLFQKVSDAEIDVIHKIGIYYNRVHSHWDGLFLNNAVQALLVRKQPIRCDGDQVLAPPLKIKFIKRFVPDTTNNVWIENNDVNDGFMDLLAEHKPDDSMPQEEFERFKVNLREIHDLSPLAVERSLELLQGPTSTSSWHQRYELEALEIESDESPKRITTHQDKSEDRKGVIYRRQRLHASFEAATLHTQALNWGQPLSAEIGKGFNYCWKSNHPHSNVVSIEGHGDRSTLLYLGSCTRDKANSEHAKMVKLLRVHAAETSDEEKCMENMARVSDRLCVVYREALTHTYKIIHKPDGKTSITTPANQSSTSVVTED